ncbi:uncharacterized protein METZ01_LOCUS5033 [marine metagenome]|uniref:Uncharacterized protein n=1 Tax=marine metagenome TaxID=408172 RepID=A0A381NCK0_9ZZZZ
MIAFLNHIVEDRGRPTLSQLLNGADVNNSIVEITLKARHMTSQEASVLPN